MQVGSLGDDTKMLKAIGETSEGMAVDTHVEEAQADAAAAAVPDEAARMAEGFVAQETPRVHEEAPWRIQGARRPPSANANELWTFRNGAIQLQGTTASVQEMWQELTADQMVPLWPTWMPVWRERDLEMHRCLYLPLQQTPLAVLLFIAGKQKQWVVRPGGKMRITEVVPKKRTEPTSVTSPPAMQTRPSLPSRTVPSAQLPAVVEIHNLPLGNAWSKKPAAPQQEPTAAAPAPSHAEQEMGARISVLEEKFELFSRQPAPAAATPAAMAPAFVFASPSVPQPPTAIETQLRKALEEAMAVTKFQAARWDTEFERRTVREKKQEEEMAELRALLASKIKENEELKAAPPKTVHDPTQYGPRAQLTIRQQEQPPQQEEETVFTVEVKMATPEKVTSQQSQYDASPELRGPASREGGRSRSPSPISSPRAAAAAAKQQPNGRSQYPPIRKDLLLQWTAQVDANVAEVVALLEADTEEEAAAESAQAAAAEAEAAAAAAEAAAAAGAKGTGSGQFRVGDTESDEDSEKDEEVSESDDYGGMWQ